MRAALPRAAVAAVAVVLAGCGGGSDKPATAAGTSAPKVIQPGAPGEPSREVVATATPAGGVFSSTDVEFMQGMIHHHQQAVTMADWVPDRSQSTSIRVMARRMAVSQQDEMLLMRNWLKQRMVDPDDHSHRHRMMPGMMSSAEFERLKAARGKTFDRLFLRYMTRHHQGALTMVQDLVDDGGGGEPDLQQFILHVDSDQTIEIERMQQLLRGL